MELGKEINFNDEMTLYDAEKIKNELYSKNRFKDICISVTIERIVPSLKNYYLINLNGQDYLLLKKWIYITCFILTFDQLYTLYLESLCSYQFFVIRKIISSRNNVLENEKYSKFTTGYTINNNNFVAERKSIGGISTDIEPELPTEEEIEKANSNFISSIGEEFYQKIINSSKSIQSSEKTTIIIYIIIHIITI